MKRILNTIILLLAFTCTIAAQDSLSTYLKIAAENNANLKASYNQYLAALEQVPQVGTLPDLKLSFAYFIQPIQTKEGPQDAVISVSQMFPWFGSLSAAGDAATASAKAKYEQFENQKSKLFYEVKATYYNLNFISHAIATINEDLVILNSFKDLAKIKVESGSRSSVDLYRIELEINDLTNQLSLLNDKQNVLLVKFNNLLNRDQNELVNLLEDYDNSLILNKETSLQTVIQNNKELASFDYQIEALENQESVMKKAGMPKFSVGMSYSVIGNGGEDAILFPSVGISVPLYRNKYKAMVRETLYMKEAKKESKIEKENVLESIFENAWKDYSDASRRIVLNQKQADLAKKAMNILEFEYSTGKTDFDDILRMERQLLKYQLEFKKAQSDQAASIAFIQYLQGK